MAKYIQECKVLGYYSDGNPTKIEDRGRALPQYLQTGTPTPLFSISAIYIHSGPDVLMRCCHYGSWHHASFCSSLRMGTIQPFPFHISRSRTGNEADIQPALEMKPQPHCFCVGVQGQGRGLVNGKSQWITPIMLSWVDTGI